MRARADARRIWRRQLLNRWVGCITASALAAGCVPSQGIENPARASRQASPPYVETLSGSRPNIIFILADDLGYGEVGVYGQTRIQTPNIDRLASEGMRFTNFYAGGPVCAPSRGALMQGKTTGRITNRANYLRRPFVERGEKIRVGLNADDLTLAELLKGRGYRTGIFGKWHLEDYTDPKRESWPHKKGFDTSLVPIIGWGTNGYYPESIYHADQRVMIPENAGQQKNLHIDDMVMDASAAFAKSAVGGKQPFFIFLSLKSPHEPFDINSTGMYEKQEWPDVEKIHAAQITKMDQTVGRIVAMVDKLDISNNTLIVFSSDNGPQGVKPHNVDFFDSNGPLRGIKGDLYEGGLRVPTIFRWPGRIGPGLISVQRGAFWDFMPTFADLAGATVPAGETDGISIVRALKQRNLIRRSHLYWEYQTEDRFSQAVIDGNWKLVRSVAYGKSSDEVRELYNLKADPSESRSVARENPDEVARLLALANRSHVPSKDFPAPWEEK